MSNDGPSPTARLAGPDQGAASVSDFVTVARIIKTQGRRGEVAATLLTSFPEKFAERRRLFALGAQPDQRKQLAVEEHWFHKGLVVLKFAGVDSISEAETLIGLELQVPTQERVELPAGEFYVSDLVGCMALDQQHEIGRIKDVQFGSGEAPLLVILGSKEFLVPFATAYIEKVDLKGKRLDMKLPEGMLELDAPLSRQEKQDQQKPGHEE